MTSYTGDRRLQMPKEEQDQRARRPYLAPRLAKGPRLSAVTAGTAVSGTFK